MAGVKQGRDGAVGILTLNEPESLNAMTPDLLGALQKAVAEMTADPDIRALVLTGEGRGFCSGGDVDEIIGATLAMQEASIVVATVMREFTLELAPGHEVWPMHRVTVRPDGGLPMIIRRR